MERRKTWPQLSERTRSAHGGAFSPAQQSKIRRRNLPTRVHIQVGADFKTNSGRCKTCSQVKRLSGGGIDQTFLFSRCFTGRSKAAAASFVSNFLPLNTRGCVVAPVLPQRSAVNQVLLAVAAAAACCLLLSQIGRLDLSLRVALWSCVHIESRQIFDNGRGT